jgi:hypothetical protein
MFQQFTTILILTAITLQGVFGGLQHSVSICLGGGHEHEIAEVAEHCELECTHHSSWPTPISSDIDIEDCPCTDFELSLITLLSTPRNAADSFIALPSFDNVIAKIVELQPLYSLRGPPINPDLIFGAKQQQLVVVRTTRLLL